MPKVRPLFIYLIIHLFVRLIVIETSFLQFVFISDVFVDYEKGLDSPTCGQSSTPCKTLGLAVDRTPDHGTINVHGN